MRPGISVYLAAPFFNEGERRTNAAVLGGLESAGVEVFYPMRDGVLLSELIASGVGHPAAARKVWECDLAALHSCHCVVAILDGRVPDEGVSVEIGLAAALKKPVFGFFTEQRTCFGTGLHPMITAALSGLFDDAQELAAAVCAHMKYKLQ